MDVGRVEEINIGPEKTLPAPVERVAAHAGKGLVGNRYYFEHGAAPGVALTLIAAEALDAMTTEHGIEFTAAESRRNILTRGIDLNALVGRTFRIGAVKCVGVELCHPCASLERLTQPGVIKGLMNRGGLNADILSDGEIAVGDEVAVTD
ncbi:MAG: MOSC domain-containing protein [Gaiellaceae bacterium]